MRPSFSGKLFRVKISNEHFKQIKQPLLHHPIKLLFSGFQRVAAFRNGSCIEDEPANAQQEAIKAVVSVNADAAKHAHIWINQCHLGHAQRRAPGLRRQGAVHPRQTRHAHEHGLQHLIGRDVRREFIVGADGDALLQLARCEGRRQFQFPTDRAHWLSSRLIIAVQPLLEQVHAAGRQHLGQQLRVAFVVIEAHPDLIVEIEKVPRIAKHVVEVRNGDFADIGHLPCCFTTH